MAASKGFSDHQLHERLQQRFASLSGVVPTLADTEGYWFRLMQSNMSSGCRQCAEYRRSP